jgi:iron uptake system component EfeO
VTARRKAVRPAAAAGALPALGAMALVAALTAGCGSTQADRAAGGTDVTFTTGVCGARPQQLRPGMQVFQLKNEANSGAEVDLISPATGAVYGEVEALGPRTTRPMRVDLGSGSYEFRCIIADLDPFTGPVFTIGGHVTGAAGIVPVTNNDLVPPAREYHAYVASGLVVLARQVRQLAADVQAGRLAAARSAWLPAHLTYERLGAAYDAFGDFDGEIDGRADGLAGGVDSPDFTGFYRLEYGLWHGQPASELQGPAKQLYRYVLGLQASWPASEIDLLDVGLRTHEILENALQFQLSGHDDYGSGTTLATTAANITGTEELLTVLHPLLVPRYAGLPQVYRGLAQLQRLLQAQHHGGSWTSVSKLSMIAREQIDAACSQLLEDLAPIAVITEPRLVS